MFVCQGFLSLVQLKKGKTAFHENDDTKDELVERTSGQGAADYRKYREAAGAIAEAVIRSVESIVQAEAKLQI